MVAWLIKNVNEPLWQQPKTSIENMVDGIPAYGRGIAL